MTFLNNSVKLIKSVQTILKNESEYTVNDFNNLNSNILNVNSNVSGYPADCFILTETGNNPQIMNQENKLSITERKKYSEREITYNLLLRRLVDDYLDKTITYSQQPKHILNILKCVLLRNFPELNDSFHWEKLRAYLKACRRNAKRNSGKPYVRTRIRYLSCGKATSLAEEIYQREHSYLTGMISSNTESNRLVERSISIADCRETFGIKMKNPKTTMHQLPYQSRLHQTDLQATSYTISCNNDNVKNSSYFIPVTMSQQISTSLNSLPQQHIDGIAFVKLLEQTAEFLLLMADRLDADQAMFSQNGLYNIKP
ncbi:hypothetical protein EWB00_002004 [Schistosoma japonicum]|uniref:Nucleolar protein 4 helical domain-containing protein n=2 Tax=Schistosoma japonicum TaxID=6182 RepID=A0A4Z2DDS6_SCHJA|nr:hypothetical protein EWB00_002004 [Schistosoma japonicum]